METVSSACVRASGHRSHSRYVVAPGRWATTVVPSAPTRPEYATSAAIAAGADPQAYSFNYAIANPKDKKSAKKLLPKKREPVDVVALLNREFAEATGIRHYRL